MNKIGLIFLILTIATIVLAELPTTIHQRRLQQQQQRFRQQRIQSFGRQEATTTATTDQPDDESVTTTDNGESAPYPPSGYRPDRAFLLPTADGQYGVPIDEARNNNDDDVAESTTSADDNDGPYPPSGWKPSGRLLTLPMRQYAPTLATNYGTPAQEYGEPTEETIINDSENTIEPDTESVENVPNDIDNNQQPPKQQDGAYFIQLPDGSLQRIVYLTASDLQNMNINAKLQPVFQQLIQQPIYSSGVNPSAKVVSYSSQYQSW